MANNKRGSRLGNLQKSTQPQKRTIKKTLQAYHRERVEQATRDPNGLWRISKWATNREGRTIVIPPLKRKDGTIIDSYEGKVSALRQTFFAEPDPPDLTDIIYPVAKLEIMLFITEQEVHKAITKTSPDKVLEPDGILSRILVLVALYIAKHLITLFNAYINHLYSLRALGHRPRL